MWVLQSSSSFAKGNQTLPALDWLEVGYVIILSLSLDLLTVTGVAI